MTKDPKISLQDILFSIESIEKFTKGMSSGGFKQNLMVQDAVIRRFAVIGEAANKLPNDVKENHKEIEWKKIIGTRNFLLHEYFNIDLDIVWSTIKLDLPLLKKQIIKVLAGYDSKTDK